MCHFVRADTPPFICKKNSILCSPQFSVSIEEEKSYFTFELKLKDKLDFLVIELVQKYVAHNRQSYLAS